MAGPPRQTVTAGMFEQLKVHQLAHILEAALNLDAAGAARFVDHVHRLGVAGVAALVQADLGR